MWAKILIDLAGGARASIFLSLFLFASATAIYYKSGLNRQMQLHQSYVSSVIAATSKARDSANTASLAAKDALIEYNQKSKEAESSYAAGRESAIHAQTTLVSDLRNGNQRLQQQWRGCESNRVREGQGVAGTASGQDAEADLRAEGAGYLVGNADYADGWIVWLQSELIATRELYGKCIVPKTK